MAPLPRAYQWCDGSAYLLQAELVRKARKAETPDFLYHDPLMLTGKIAPTRLQGINLRGVFRFPVERYADEILPSLITAKTGTNE